MTIDDDITPAVQRYRASAEEISTPLLDQVILAAATRQASRQRVARRVAGASALTAIAMLCVAGGWYANQTNRPRSVTNYGQLEGSTRAYLLRVGQSEFSGPGIEEATP